MSNIRDVARAAGVSVATVSRALTNPEKLSKTTLERVQAAVEAMNYRPNLLARNFRSARSYAAVVLVPDITNPFFAQVIQAIEDSAQQQGYAILLGDTRDSSRREREYVDRVETRLADGVIQLRPHGMSASSQSIPWVNACGCETTPGPSVRIDNVGSARRVVEHLIALGHRRIGVISGLADNPHSGERLLGYRQALTAAGIEPEPSLLAEGDFTMWSGQRAIEQFLSLKEAPTAVFCMSDQMAIGAIQHLNKAGLRVPADISVAGFDDIRFAEFWQPGITTIAQPAELIGKTSFDVLLKAINGEDMQSEQIILPTRLVERGSTAAPGHPAQRRKRLNR